LFKGELGKELLKPFPAKYSEEYLNPLSNDDPIKSYLFTDETGNVYFSINIKDM
jgi:hypothetical protein